MSASVSSAAVPSRRGSLLRGAFAMFAAVLALGGAAANADTEPQSVNSADSNHSFIWG